MIVLIESGLQPSTGICIATQAVEEVPVRNMAARLGIERGALQALQKEASVFCGMVVCFCRHLQWHEVANVLYSFQVSNGREGGAYNSFSGGCSATTAVKWSRARAVLDEINLAC